MIDRKIKKYISLQTNKDRKMIKRTLGFKLKFNNVGTPKRDHTKTYREHT